MAVQRQKMVAKLWQTLGLLALVAVVSVYGQVTVTIALFQASGCSGSPAGPPATYDNGTSCFEPFPGYYFDFYCNATGNPYGQSCSGGCPSGTCAPATGDQTWGQPMCVEGASGSASVTCNEPASPDAPVSFSPLAPVPSAVIPPDAVPPAWNFPNDLVGSGTVSILPYLADNCATPYNPAFDLTADITLCQRKNIAGFGDLYLRADCFAANSSSYAWFCGGDTTCSDCTLFDSTPSGQCLNYRYSALKSVLFTCPSNTPTPAPADPTPTPSGDASSLSFVYATFFIILGVASLLI